MRTMFLLSRALLAVTLIVAGCQSVKQFTPKSDQSKSSYDVVVVGSELEGIYLAKAAMDEGLRVLVLDPRGKPGGQLLQGEMLYLDEPHDKSGKSLLQGDVKTLFDRFKSGQVRKKNEFEGYYQELTSGIPSVSGIKIQSITEKPFGDLKQVDSLTYQDSANVTRTIQASYWVENTDFTALTSKLGVKRIPGIETIYKEPKIDYMAASMMMKFKNVDWSELKKAVAGLSQTERNQKFGDNTMVNDTFVDGFSKITSNYQSSSDDLFVRGFNGVNQDDGEVLVNALLVYNVNPSSDVSVQSALSRARNEMPRILEYLQANMPGWSHAEQNGFPDYLYIREYNRYETEYVLQQSDLMSSRMFWDNVSIGGYPIDMQGTMAYKWGTRLGNPDRYGMPLRSFELKGYENVLVAGKNVGAAEDAYGSTRIQANTSLAAQLIGVLLGEGKKSGKRLRSLNETDFEHLHEYLIKKYNIVLDR